MEKIDLDSVCDVCGRPGQRKLAQQADDLIVVICPACRWQGAHDVHAIARSYGSRRDQAHAKQMQHDKFRRLPRPGIYPARFPADHVDFPPLCSCCLGEPDGIVPIRQPERLDRPWFRFVPAVIALGAGWYEHDLLIVTVGLFLGAWGLWKQYQLPDVSPGVLRVPICTACRERTVAGQAIAPVRLGQRRGSGMRLEFYNWEYASLTAEANRGLLDD